MNSRRDAHIFNCNLCFLSVLMQKANNIMHLSIEFERGVTSIKKINKQ